MANIKDIAKHANVSIATVSRALSQPEIVSAKTMARIEKAIEELDYEPNHLAAGLRRQRSDNVLVAVPSIFNPFTSAFVQGIENIARANKMRVLLGITDGDPALLDRFVAMIAGKQADGLILLETNLPSIATRKPAGASMPPIVAACEYPADLNLPRVNIDSIEAAALVVRHLAELGHRRIAAICGPSTQNMTRERLEGFRLGLARAQIDPNSAPVFDGDFTLQSGHEAALRLLDEHPDITAIACHNDEMAIGALAACRQRGLSAPADISIVGFDNLRFAEYAAPPLTTIDVPTMDIGECAMRLMLDNLRAPNLPAREIILPHSLVVRESSGPPPVRGRRSR